nr:MAG TPA: hypothetical protein [Bacteriophage sp.]
MHDKAPMIAHRGFTMYKKKIKRGGSFSAPPVWVT